MAWVYTLCTPALTFLRCARMQRRFAHPSRRYRVARLRFSSTLACSAWRLSQVSSGCIDAMVERLSHYRACLHRYLSSLHPCGLDWTRFLTYRHSFEHMKHAATHLLYCRAIASTPRNTTSLSPASSPCTAGVATVRWDLFCGAGRVLACIFCCCACLLAILAVAQACVLPGAVRRTE